jgi:hypothetical protein
MNAKKLYPLVTFGLWLASSSTAWAEREGKGQASAAAAHSGHAGHAEMHGTARASAAATLPSGMPSAVPSSTASAVAATIGSAAPSAVATAADGSRRDELTEEQKAKRKEHMAELRAKWGEMLKKPGVKEEMKKHLSRLAKLRRIGRVAKDAKKDGIQKRVDAAVAKEKQRHDKTMDELKTQTAPAATGTSSGPVAPAVAPAVSAVATGVDRVVPSTPTSMPSVKGSK